MINRERYIRQMLLPEIGESGQRKLLAARVAIIGCGGLGSVVGPYLAGAGVGSLLLIDHDSPHISNLHRQVTYHADQQESKAVHLKEHLSQLNPEIEVAVYSSRLTKSNVEQLLQDYDLIVECTDDIQCKYLVNDYAHLKLKPVVYGALHKYDGYVSLFENIDYDSIHLRDIFAEPNDDIPTCSEVGVLGTAAGIIGMLQANEALKYILQIGESLADRLLTYSTLTNEQQVLKLRKTWRHDIAQVYEQSSYESASCSTSIEIDWATVSQDRTRYRVISILEDHEHIDLDDQVERMPLSQMGMYDFENETVFYCRSGARSGQLVNKILQQQPNAILYSLRGGTQGVGDTQ